MFVAFMLTSVNVCEQLVTKHFSTVMSAGLKNAIVSQLCQLNKQANNRTLTRCNSIAVCIASVNETKTYYCNHVIISP